MRRRQWVRRLVLAAVAVLVIVVAAAVVTWWKFFATTEQTFADDTERFNYGSLGAETLAGIPYPIFMILPRVFPDLVERYAREGYGPERAGHGGYGAFGLPWEEGQRLPFGLSIKRQGFERVTLNCALCHTTSYRLKPGETPRFAVGGPGHSVDMQGLLRFLFAAANDRRFTAARLMPEIQLHFDLDPIDIAIFSFILVPKTRLALQIAERELGWMNEKPAWGPGRDDAFNLPKYILARSPWDKSVGNTDFPALWRLGDRDGYLLHAGGEAGSVAAVVATSALGTGSFPAGGFDERNRWIEDFLRDLAPPPFPVDIAPIDAGLAERGKALFDANCAECHAKGGARTGKAIPLDEIGTDPAHVLTWQARDAERMNLVTRALDMDAEMLPAQGYVAKPLTGIWLLAPYLHNGSVPTLWDLLLPPPERPPVFYRGYNVVDLEKVGFIATTPEAEAEGFRFDTRLEGNGNGGHLYGTDLSEPDRWALIEYLKTL